MLVSLPLCLLCLFVLCVILALWPPVLQFQLPALLFGCVLLLLFVVVLSGETKQNQGRGLVDRKLVQAPLPPSNFIAGRLKGGLFCFGSLVILDVAWCHLWLFSLYINIKIGKNSC